MLGSPAASDPASKVSATTRLLVGSTVTSCPRRAAGNGTALGVGEVRGAGGTVGAALDGGGAAVVVGTVGPVDVGAVDVGAVDDGAGADDDAEEVGAAAGWSFPARVRSQVVTPTATSSTASTAAAAAQARWRLIHIAMSSPGCPFPAR